MPTIAELAVNLIARTEKFTSKMRGARRDVAGLQGSARGAGGGMSMLTRGLGGVAAAAAATAAAVRVVTSEFGQLDKLAKTGMRLNLDVENLQALKQAGELAGVGFNTMSMALQRSTRRIAEAAVGTGEARGALQELGLSASRLNQLSPDQQLLVLAQAFEGVTNQADKVRLAMKLFDSEGVSLVQLIDQGAGSLQRFMMELKNSGELLSGEQLDAIQGYNDAWTNLGASWDRFKSHIGVAIIPALQGLLTMLNQVMEGFRMMGAGIGALMAPLKALWKHITLTKNELADFLESIGWNPYGRTMFTQMAEDTDKIKANLPDIREASTYVIPEMSQQQADAHYGRWAEERSEQTRRESRERNKQWDREKKERDRQRAEEERLTATARSMADSVRTPSEMLKDTVAQALAHYRAGRINAEELRRISQKAYDTFKAARGASVASADGTTGAALRGTSEGFSAVRAAQRYQRELIKAARDQLTELQTMNQTLRDLGASANEHHITNPLAFAG